LSRLHIRPRRALAAALVSVPLAAAAPTVQPLTRAEIAARIAAHEPINLAGRRLEKLDLSGLDLRGADLAGADLFNAHLVGTKLVGASLAHARLDLAWLMRADFTGANLSGASLLGPVVFPGMEVVAADAPRFAHADFSGARIIARFSDGDLRGADFAHANLGADLRNQSMGLLHTEFIDSDLRGASFAGANLAYADFSFAKLQGADLRGAHLHRANFSGANLTGADLTGADAAEADFGGAVLTGAKGLATVTGQTLRAPSP
jgi:uncharacterized protein YjbI with pentapeptide repeats